MAEMTQLAKVRESYGRCVLSDTFFEDFYDSFMGSSSEIRAYFSKTDMAKQRSLLREGISFMLLYAGQKSSGKIAIEHIGKIHDNEHINVRPELYPLWVESLLKCVEKHDKYFDEEVRAAWKEILEPGINHFKDVYIPKKSEDKA